MPEESKEINSNGKAPAEGKLDKGKQPAVASDDEDDVEDVAVGDNANDAEGTASTSKKKKKKSKRRKVKDALTGQSSNDPTDKIKALLDKLPENELQELVKRNPELLKDHGSDPSKAADAFKSMSMNDLLTGLALSGKNVKDMGNYKFWKTQPVPKFDEVFDKPADEGPLEHKTVEDVSKEPQHLIDGFEWVTMDLTDDGQMKEVYQLLNGHYVEDDEAMFRFNYGTAILRWSLMAPGWKPDWHVGIRDCRVKDRRPLVAFISAVPMTVRVRNKSFVASEVNFLCVHKKLRGKRLAPILIKEVTRRSNLHGIWQGVYTGGIVLPKPVSTCRYYHRSLDWKKLYEIKFSPLPPNSKPEWQIRKFALPDTTATPGLREMQKKDVPAVHKLMSRYQARFDLGVDWTEEETAHWLLQPRGAGDEQAVWTYVVEDEHKNITDFFSFYNLESTIIDHPKHKVMKVAYLFYYGSETGLATPCDKATLRDRLNKLIGDALILAKQYKFDVFNALSLMDNTLFLEQQKFGPGDGSLHYYLFNYRANPIAGGVNRKNQADEENGSGIGLVMM